MRKKQHYFFIFMLVIATTAPIVASLDLKTLTPMTPLDVTGLMTRTDWNETQKLLASDGSTGDIFGRFMSLSGDTLLIGAHCNDDLGPDSGSAYVFVRNGDTWAQQAKLLASDGAGGDYFGWSVSLDGNTAIIGAIADDDNGAQSGSAYIFTRGGTTWTQQAKLTASDGATGDSFGYSVSLSGETAIVGAPEDDDQGDYTGSAYVFIRTGATWSQQAKLVPTGAAAQDYTGSAVFVDGNTALIGAPYDDDNGADTGTVYAFTRSGTTWTQQAKLFSSDSSLASGFGSSLSFSNETALIGASSDNDNGIDAGAAYVFVRTGTTWAQQAKLLTSDGEMYDYFGSSTSISGDVALIGAPFEDDAGNSAGSAYVFVRTGTTWAEEEKLLGSDGTDMDWFGGSVSVEGLTAFVSAYGHDANGDESGCAYLFLGEVSNEPPLADFSWSPETACPGQPVFFDASASTDPDGVITLYEWDWENDAVYDESYAIPTATHAWDTIGEFTVTLRVTDNDGAVATHSAALTINPNHSPNTPTIQGPSEGRFGTPTQYNFTATDPDGHDLCYLIDWDDSTATDWIGPYASGETIVQSHTWSKRGTYTIKAKVKDYTGNESAWGTLTIKMPCSYDLPFQVFWGKFFAVFPFAFPVLRYLFRL